jgi:cation:H+ antiporter
MWTNLIILIASGVLLTWAAGIVVTNVSVVARRMGLGNFTVGFLLLGVLTSTPEIFVALQSAIGGVPALSVGNLLGGSILLLSFVMGTVAILLGKVTLDHRLSVRELALMTGVIAAPVAVLWDERLTRAEGVFLVGTWIVHAVVLNRGVKKRQKKTRDVWTWHWMRSRVAKIAAGVVFLFVSSRLIVTSATAILSTVQIAPVAFGLFVISLGTNMPEFALAIESIRSRRREIAFGDFLGSSAANTLILGLLGIAVPFHVDSGRVLGALLLLGSISGYFFWAVSSGKSITRKEGIGLLVFYLLFAMCELLV